MTAPAKVYAHIGLHKTGTTYLQNMLRANREILGRLDVEFVAGPGKPGQSLAVSDLQGRRPRGTGDERIAGSWQALVEAINGSTLRAALVSDERLSVSTLKQVRRFVSAFPGSEVEVIVTLRDLGRVAVSAWQEEVKNDKTWSWAEFSTAIRDPERIAQNPARGFWLRQDAVKICETWESMVPTSRIHVVTVPQSPSPPEVLLQRFAAVVGFDPAALTKEPVWANETIGVAATEVIRQLNLRLDGRLNQREYDVVVKRALAPLLAKKTEPVRFTLPAEDLPWISARADQMIAELVSHGYPVVGDLAELRPERREGRRPDDATDAELLDTSLNALTLLAEQYASSWWSRRRRSPSMRKSDLSGRARGALFRTQRKATDLADKNPAAAKAVAAVLKARDRARSRARARNAETR